MAGGDGFGRGLHSLNTLRPRQNGRRFADDTLDENLELRLRFHWSFFPKGPINNNPALVQIMAWRRSGDKPLSEPMMVYWCIYASLGLNELMSYGVCGMIWNKCIPYCIFWACGIFSGHIHFKSVCITNALQMYVPWKKFHMPCWYLHYPHKPFKI